MTGFSKLQTRCVAAVLVGLMGISLAFASHVEYKFKVRNKTKVAIKKLLASPDGKKYGFFDIGAGIKPGATVELVWDKTTDKSNCEWYFKAVFADGEESEAEEFDFCEDDLVLEFSE
jgi:hypothetical protein